MPTVIDSLIVTLGLDPSLYKQGAAQAKAAQANLKNSLTTGTKQVNQANTASGASAQKLGKTQNQLALDAEKRRKAQQAAIRKQQQQEQKDTDATIGRLKSIGLFASATILGFDSLKGALSTLVSVNQDLAQMGRFAPTVGATAQEIDVMGKALSQVGGNAKDAQADIARLAHAGFSVLMHQPDAFAGFLRRLGVSPLDQNQHQRKYADVTSDVFDKIRQSTPDLEQQAMYAREMGYSEATIQLYLVKSAAERKSILDSAEKTAHATKEATENAARLDSAWGRIKNNVNGAYQNILGFTGGSTADLAEGAASYLEKPKGISDYLAQGAVASLPGGIVGGLVSLFAGKLYHDKVLKPESSDKIRAKKSAQPYLGALDAAEKKYGLPAGVLTGVANTESNFNPNARSSAGAVGLMQLMPNLFPGAGKNAFGDIDTAGRELGRLYRTYSATYGPEKGLQLALAAYNGGQGNIDKRLAQAATGKPVTPLKQETQDYIPKVLAAAQSSSGAAANAAFAANAAAPTASSSLTAGAAAPVSGGNTSVQIDKIEVHTQATDANGIAATLPGTLKRKGVVAQANSGTS